MRRPRLLLALALGLCAAAAPAAEAAKVTETAAGITVPNATGGGAPPPTLEGEGSQSFKLSGKKVKKRQVLDVNLVLNASSGGATELNDLLVTLVGPKGDNVQILTPGGRAWVDLKLDDQSNLFPCDPAFNRGSNCNYLQGNTTFTGSVHAEITPTFLGLNPKGTWRLLFRDVGTGAEPPTTIGVSTLEVKTGRKFAKG
jgi:hypothetical protein